MDRLKRGAFKAKRQVDSILRNLLDEINCEPFVHSQDLKWSSTAFML